MCNQRVVVITHSATYADPITVESGGMVTLSGRQDIWNGHLWLWTVANDGREGWVPESLVNSKKPAIQTARFAYSAKELSCERGEQLTAVKSSHGWTWCCNAMGCAGWVPDENLSPVKI